MTETTSSVAMEKEAFHQCVEAVKVVGLKIAMIVTACYRESGGVPLWVY